MRLLRISLWPFRGKLASVLAASSSWSERKRPTAIHRLKNKLAMSAAAFHLIPHHPSKQKEIIPVLKTSFPVTDARIPCFFASGIGQESPLFWALPALSERYRGAVFSNFPVFFPDIREFSAETGWRLTTSSAND